MSDDFPGIGIDLDEIENAVDQLQEAYADGLMASQEINEEVVGDIDPSHKIIIDIELTANVQNHKYEVIGQLVFLVDLNSLLEIEGGKMEELSTVLDELDESMTKMEKENIMEQLAMPRAVGYLEEVDLESFILFDEDGKKVKIDLNENASILLTKQDGSLLLNFEGVFTYPKIDRTLYFSVPSSEKMQENIVFDLGFLDEELDFEWEEEDKDGLTVSGTAIIKEL